MKPVENLEKLIRELHVLDINTSAEMDQRILHDTLKVQKECKKTKLAGNRPDIWRTIMKNPIIKSAAVIAVVVSVGAIAVVGVNVGRYFYYGRNDAGDYIFVSEDRQSVDTLGADEVTDVDQTIRDLEEIKLLSQLDQRKLIGVDELLANGKLERRVFTYQYQLSDGRTMDMREAHELNFVLNQKQRQECIQYWHAGSGEDLGTYEQNVKGRLFVFKQKKFVLSDGTEIISSVGTPKDKQ
jgi:hypothetical protein